MFNFVCRTLLLHAGRIWSISNSVYKDFAFPVFIKCISTITTSNQHSFTVSYLINSCGFSQKSALSASKYLHFESPEKADSVIALFKSHGFSETQISKALRVVPQLLCASPEKTLLPKLQFFNSKGFSIPELAKILSVRPTFMGRSIENFLIPCFNEIGDLFQCDETAVAAVKLNPFILRRDFKTVVAPIIHALWHIGVPERNVILFLKMRLQFKKTSAAAIKNAVDEIKEMGISPLSVRFIVALIAKLRARSTWESKVKIYRRWGWSEEEVLAAFCKNPHCMLASKDKIMTVMDFLVNQMDMESSAIARRPDIILLSMEKRFIPRAAVFQFLLSKGLVKRENSNLITLFTVPEKCFLKKFVNGYDEAPELLKLYEEKLGLSNMTSRMLLL